MPRRPARTVTAAETRAYKGQTESQESSQSILDRYRAEHGIGVLSSSPRANYQQFKRQDDLEEAQAGSAGPSMGIAKPSSPASHRTSTGGLGPALEITTTTNSAGVCEAPTSQRQANAGHATTSAHPGRPPATLRKMDISQSPTQSNDGRSYEQYPTISETLHADPDHGITQGSNHNPTQQSTNYGDSFHRTLGENDTGAVNFDLTLPKSVPFQSEPDDYHHGVGTDTQARSGIGLEPETPAVAPRPFQKAASDSLMGLSQLFQQTQATSALKRLSPTSSRPSPNIFGANDISPNVLSSPTKGRGLQTSPLNQFTSPAMLPTTSPYPTVGEQTPAPPPSSSRPPESSQHSEANTEEEQTVPESPRIGARNRAGPEPIGEYRSLLQARSMVQAAEAQNIGDDQTDSDDDFGEVERRRLVRMKKEKANRSLESINFPSSGKEDDVEVPSTSRKSEKTNSSARDFQKLSNAKSQPHEDDTQDLDTVVDSQEAKGPPNQAITGNNSQTTNLNPDENRIVLEDQIPSSDGLEEQQPVRASKETIPETSPVGKSLETPRLLGDILNRQSSSNAESVAVSFPVLSNTDIEAPVVSSQSSSLRRSGRVRNSETPLLPSSTAPAAQSATSTGTSSLSALASTPDVSSSITPNTEDTGAQRNQEQASSPAAARRERSRPSSLPRLKTYSARNLRDARVDGKKARRLTRHSSISTDELMRPPTAPTNPAVSAPSAANSGDERGRPRKMARKSLGKEHNLRESFGPGLLQGMVFAISYQSQQPTESNERYTQREKDSSAIQDKITEAGGRVLAEGFNELFETASFRSSTTSPAGLDSVDDLRLLPEAQGYRFTALISDGHSRKVKYMQALALGLPCLSPKWITACLNKGELVAWEPYLLCAGQSKILDNAIRSRTLQPYDAATARLADVINQRPQMLRRSHVLLVMKKSRDEQKKMSYIFLAHVLGASLVRVHSFEEARAKLVERELLEQPFDWVYIDGDGKDADTTLFGPGTVYTHGLVKKRKRQAEVAAQEAPAPKRVRKLNSELVVQSLILGRLIEEGEMEE